MTKSNKLSSLSDANTIHTVIARNKRNSIENEINASKRMNEEKKSAHAMSEAMKMPKILQCE